MSTFTQPVALVTGTASGIGAAIAKELCRVGWKVAGLDLRPSNTDMSFIADVTDSQDLADIVTQVEDTLGPIAALVSAAGYYEVSPVSLISETSWTRMLSVHLGGLVNTTRAVLPAMLSREAGCVVAISSELAIGGGCGDAHYAAAKGAILGFVRSLAIEVAPAGIRVNAVAPGPTDTPLLEPDSPWRDPGYLATLPAGRLATPDEIAVAVRFLVEEGTFLVGEVLSVNSGAVI